ncbi:magnesium transporter NIPA2 [Fopius arisanus]|uniref:Magnesium transporter NIPA2 n=1 Tax=Fopius arisanus TaxID=64838 RepID=A0A0C9RGN8_9HYME|nr:PREDICTED: magnesium transporter NIPA2 [Fopius arisanus]
MEKDNSNSWEFYVGLVLAVSSNVFIGISFIIKKSALVNLQRYGLRAGAGGHGYLREWMWWAGLLSMGIGEAANFVAYAFAPASIVTPLGVLSIVIAAILSPRYLHEKLNLLGKLGCFLSIVGSTIIVLHAPKTEEINTVEDLVYRLQHSGFTLYIIFVILTTLLLIFHVGPRHGKENVTIYVFLCSIVGSLTVMSCKILGLSIKETIYTENNRMEDWLTWVSLFSIILCIMVQMNYLNKALDLFNTAIVTPVYYIFFTTFVIIASAILFEEWQIMTYQNILGSICGFFVVITAIFLMNAFKDLNFTYFDLKTLSLSRTGRRSVQRYSYDEEMPQPVNRDVVDRNNYLDT